MITLISSKKLGVYKIIRNTVIHRELRTRVVLAKSFKIYELFFMIYFLVQVEEEQIVLDELKLPNLNRVGLWRLCNNSNNPNNPFNPWAYLQIGPNWYQVKLNFGKFMKQISNPKTYSILNPKLSQVKKVDKTLKNNFFRHFFTKNIFSKLVYLFLFLFLIYF